MTEVKEEAKPRGRRKPVQKIISEEELTNMDKAEVEVIEAPVTVKAKKTKGIIAVDNGGDNTKVFSQSMEKPTYFKSKKRYGDKSHYLLETFEKYEDDEAMRSYIVEYKGLIYLTNLRTAQSDFEMTGNTKSKANMYFIISTLIAVAKFGYDINYLVTSIPLKYKHSEDVNKIKEKLVGEHEIKIDNKVYNFEIRKVDVEPEAQSALLHLLPEGKSTLLELGSRTVGFATNIVEFDENGYIKVINHIPQKSDTIEQAGVLISNLKESDYFPYCSNIYSRMSSMAKITEDDKIIAFGGGVLIEGIREGLKEFFNNIEFVDDPLYAQVIGMLYLGEDEFGDEIEDDDE